MNKNNIFVALVVIIVIIGGYFFPTGKTVVERVAEKLGAVSGPVIDSPYLTVNGVDTWYASQSFSNASTTRCAIQSPTHASSFLINGLVKSGTTTDYILAVAKATTAFATTTTIRTETVTSNSTVTFPVASTTFNGLSQIDRTFAAGEWLVISTAGPTATSFDVGTCSAEFLVGGI